MNKPGKRFELLANIAIIIIALLLCAVLTKQYFSSGTRRYAAEADTDPRVPAGTKISLPSVEWSSEKTLLLVLSTKCRYCSDSAPFYRRLLGALEKRRDIKLVAVLPESVSESEAYMKGLSVPLGNVMQAPLEVLKVRATPTLLLLDSSGSVIKSWLGRLTANEEDEVLSALEGSVEKQSASESDKAFIIEATELQKKIVSGARVVVVDIRERPQYRQKHIAGATNIPLDELSVRAQNELGESDFIAVYSDCARCASDEQSETAREILSSLGFRHSFVLRDGIEAWARASLPMAGS